MPSSESVKILVVDDAAFMRAVLKDILNSNGFTSTVEAGDGALAVELYQKNKPDLVTLDVNMPGTDGIQALKKIIDFDPRAKVIMVTAVEQRNIIQEAIKLGAKDYVVKPFDRAMVATVVNRVLRSK